MSSERSATGRDRGDDRVLLSTRALAGFIAPFLLAAFVLLYGFPGETARLWAWTIQAPMTSMLLASAYLGGCYFFLRVLRAQRWAAVRAGWVAVALFATLLGIATVVHWDRFRHGHVAFWLWAGLYFAAPILVVAVWVANHRYAGRPAPSEPRLGGVSRAMVAGTGGLALATGLALFFLPTRAVPLWPWPLTPLTSRVVGATFCLGCAGLVAVVDSRLVAVQLLLRVELVMFGLILVAAARARHGFLTDRPLTWAMGAGFIAVFAATGAVVLRERHVAC